MNDVLIINLPLISSLNDNDLLILEAQNGTHTVKISTLKSFILDNISIGAIGDYNELTNLPKINGVVLKGDILSQNLGIKDGETPNIGSNGNWFIGGIDTNKPSQGEQGEKGDPGADGKSATIRIGHVTTGSVAQVTNSGTETNAVLDFVIPISEGSEGVPGENGATFIPNVSLSGILSWTNDKDLVNPDPVNIKGDKGDKGDTGEQGIQGPQGEKGDPGADGKAATIRVGSVTTGDTAKVTNTGTETDAVFDFVIPQGGSGSVNNGVPSGGTIGQVLTKRSGEDYDMEWSNPSAEGGGDIPDISQIRDRTYLIEIPDTKELTIADNQQEILQTVNNGKYKYLNIPDGIKHWAATDPKYNYPQKLTMEYIRNSEFYANMWLPNELNVHDSLRYKVNTNGTIRYDNLNDKTDMVGLLPWGICMLAQGKEYPSGTVHFVVSNFKTLGFHSKKRTWELVHELYPIASMFNVKDTVADSDVVDLQSENLGNGYYSFAVSSDKWHNSQGKDMCFHFFPKTGIMAEALKPYENVIVTYEMSIQEPQYDETFTTMAGADAKTSGGANDAECFYSRFQAVRPYTKLINATSVIESESYKYVFSTEKIYSLLNQSGSSGGESGSQHTELDYLILDGKCFFDTGIKPDINSKFEIKCNPINFELSGSYICGINDSVYKYGLTGTDNWYVVRGKVTSAAKSVAWYSQDWVIKQDGDNVTFNESQVMLDASSELSPSGNFFVGNMSDGSGGAKGDNGLNGKLYYIKLWSGNDLIFDGIPVRKSDNTLCLYDQIKKVYIENLGMGHILA